MTAHASKPKKKKKYTSMFKLKKEDPHTSPVSEVNYVVQENKKIKLLEVY